MLLNSTGRARAGTCSLGLWHIVLKSIFMIGDYPIVRRFYLAYYIVAGCQYTATSDGKNAEKYANNKNNGSYVIVNYIHI
jgi:hypothetical protein